MSFERVRPIASGHPVSVSSPLLVTYADSLTRMRPPGSARSQMLSWLVAYRAFPKLDDSKSLETSKRYLDAMCCMGGLLNEFGEGHTSPMLAIPPPPQRPALSLAAGEWDSISCSYGTPSGKSRQNPNRSGLMSCLRKQAAGGEPPPSYLTLHLSRPSEDDDPAINPATGEVENTLSEVLTIFFGEVSRPAFSDNGMNELSRAWPIRARPLARVLFLLENKPREQLCFRSRV